MIVIILNLCNVLISHSLFFLAAFTFAALLFTFSVFGCVFEHLDKIELVDARLQVLLSEVLLNFFVFFFDVLLLHSNCLFSGGFLQVKLMKSCIFISHESALIPFLQHLCVILGLVTLEVLLDLANGINLELVEAKFKINETIVHFEALDEGLADFFI